MGFNYPQRSGSPAAAVKIYQVDMGETQIDAECQFLCENLRNLRLRSACLESTAQFE